MKAELDKLAVPFNSRGQMASVRWYKEQVRTLFENVSPASMMANKDRLVSTVTPGSMYCFFYDPKLKDKLPFYDTFPLVFPFKTMGNGFLGLNFHYLPYMLRVKLLTILMQFRTDTKMNERTRIVASWKILQSSAASNLVKPAVKHYLTSQMGSRFLMIYPDEWATAVMLPVEQFQKQNKTQVWNNSKSIIG